MRILLAQALRSGDTRDGASAICARYEERDHAVIWIDADVETLTKACPDGAAHELDMRGSGRISAARTPQQMTRFIQALVAVVGKKERLAVFSTARRREGRHMTAPRRGAALIAASRNARGRW